MNHRTLRMTVAHPASLMHVRFPRGPVWQAPGLRLAVVIVASLVGVYLAALHPWLMNWGATPEEQQMALPGDNLAPYQHFTRAITINAPVAEVWPWIVQIGQDRAGFYSHTWLENLFGGDIHNADIIRSEWQTRAVDERVPMARADYLGGALGDATWLRIHAIEPGRMISDLPARWVLVALDEHTTRVLLREPFMRPSGSLVEQIVANTLLTMVWDPTHFVMEARMLRGLQERAEGTPLTPPWLVSAARIGWVAASLGLIALYLAGRSGRFWLLVPIAVVLPPLSATGDLDAGLAGFLAVGITLLGALVFGRRWWSPYMLIAAAVLLLLLLAPDPYVAFGLGFAILVVTGLSRVLQFHRGALLGGKR